MSFRQSPHLIPNPNNPKPYGNEKYIRYSSSLMTHGKIAARVWRLCSPHCLMNNHCTIPSSLLLTNTLSIWFLFFYNLTFNLSLFSWNRAQISKIMYNTSSTVTKENTNGFSLKFINKWRSLMGWTELGATKILPPKKVKWEHLQCTTPFVVSSPTFNKDDKLCNSTVWCWVKYMFY